MLPNLLHRCYRKRCTLVTQNAALLLTENAALAVTVNTGMEARAAFAASRGKTKGVPTGENWMSIELRTVSGTDMRIQGVLTPAMLYALTKEDAGM